MERARTQGCGLDGGGAGEPSDGVEAHCVCVYLVVVQIWVADGTKAG